jgi:drug/metabolite transporter (DMT)-like permease
MLTARKIIALAMGALGVLLVVYGLSGGLWPVAVQTIAGVLLVLFAWFQWKRWNG